MYDTLEHAPICIIKVCIQRITHVVSNVSFAITCVQNFSPKMSSRNFLLFIRTLYMYMLGVYSDIFKRITTVIFQQLSSRFTVYYPFFLFLYESVCECEFVQVTSLHCRFVRFVKPTALKLLSISLVYDIGHRIYTASLLCNYHLLSRHYVQCVYCIYVDSNVMFKVIRDFFFQFPRLFVKLISYSVFFLIFSLKISMKLKN